MDIYNLIYHAMVVYPLAWAAFSSIFMLLGLVFYWTSPALGVCALHFVDSPMELIQFFLSFALLLFGSTIIAAGLLVKSLVAIKILPNRFN